MNNWYSLFQLLSLKKGMMYWPLFGLDKYKSIFPQINEASKKAHSQLIGKATDVTELFYTKKQEELIIEEFLYQIKEVLDLEKNDNKTSIFDPILHSIVPTSGSSYSFFCRFFHGKVVLTKELKNKETYIKNVIYEQIIVAPYQTEIRDVFESDLCKSDKALIDFYDEESIEDLFSMVLNVFVVKSCWNTFEQTLTPEQLSALKELKRLSH